MIIHRSPYPDLTLPPTSTTLPGFLFRPLRDEVTVASTSRSRLDEPLVHPIAHHDKYNPTPVRPNAKPLSLRDLQLRSQGWALGLQKSDWSKGNVLSVVSENQHDYAAAVLGANLLGVIAALHNPSYTAGELAHQLKLVRSKGILCSSKAYKSCVEAVRRAKEGDKKIEGEIEIWIFDEPTEGHGEKHNSWLSIFPSSSSQEEINTLWSEHQRNVSSSDDAVYCFSSGTSGTPKAVRLSHGNLVANIIQATVEMSDRTNEPLFDRWDPATEHGWYEGLSSEQAGSSSSSSKVDQVVSKVKETLHIGTAPSPVASTYSKHPEVHIDLLPQFHCYGLLVAFVAMHTCTPRYVLPRFSLPLFLHLITSYKVTFAFVVPPILLALSKSPEVDNKDEFDIASLSRLASGAAVLPRKLRRELWEKRRIKVTDGYGMSEMSPIISLQMVADLSVGEATSSSASSSSSSKKEREKLSPRNSVGRLSPSTVARVVDVSTGQDLGPNEAGVLLLDGPQKMLGYLNNDAANQESFVVEKKEEENDDGGSGGGGGAERKWLRTGDIVSIDTEGYVTIRGRAKDVLKINGFQVSLPELEESLLSHCSAEISDVAVIGIPSKLLRPSSHSQSGTSTSTPGTPPNTLSDEAEEEEEDEEVPWAFCVPSSSSSSSSSSEEQGMEMEKRLHSSAFKSSLLSRVNADLARYKHIKGLTWCDGSTVGIVAGSSEGGGGGGGAGKEEEDDADDDDGASDGNAFERDGRKRPDGIPKNASGKVLKKELRQWAVGHD